VTLCQTARIGHFMEIPRLPAMVKNDLLIKIVQFVKHIWQPPM
jgi:hypothetical protein